MSQFRARKNGTNYPVRKKISGSRKTAAQKTGIHPSIFRYDFRKQSAKAKGVKDKVKNIAI